MSDYPMLISNKLHSFRNFALQIYNIFKQSQQQHENKLFPCCLPFTFHYLSPDTVIFTYILLNGGYTRVMIGQHYFR